MNFIKESISPFLEDTNIDSLFIHEYMPEAPGDFVKVYLYAFLHANKQLMLSNDTISKHLNIHKLDVLKAWDYWENKGVIKKKNISKENEYVYNVEFISLKQQHFMKDAQLEQNVFDDNFKEMFVEIESIIGRQLTGKEPIEIRHWVEDFSLKPELIVYCYTYCKNIRKIVDFKYVEAVIRTWYDHNLYSIADVEDFLHKNDKRYLQYKDIFNALGFRRLPTDEEKKKIDQWYDEWHISTDQIMKACSKTSGITNPNINYVHKVLEGWKFGKPKPAHPNAQQQQASNLPNSPTNWATYYEKVRMKNQVALDLRRKEVYTAVPKIKEIDDEIKALNLSISRDLLSSKPDAKKNIEFLRSKINELNQNKAILLTDNNFPLDYIELKFNCGKCNDTGFMENGTRCECYKNAAS